MDEILKEQLKQIRLLPFEADEDAQEKMRAEGIDPSRVETHNSPSNAQMPKYITERCDRIRGCALALYRMEKDGKTGSDYQSIEAQMRKDLGELKPFRREGSSFWFIPSSLLEGHFFTGFEGVNRDPLPEREGVPRATGSSKIPLVCASCLDYFVE